MCDGEERDQDVRLGNRDYGGGTADRGGTDDGLRNAIFYSAFGSFSMCSSWDTVLVQATQLQKWKMALQARLRKRENWLQVGPKAGR